MSIAFLGLAEQSPVQAMRRNGNSLAAEQGRDRTAFQEAGPNILLFNERHYSVADLADLWKLGPDTIRKLFEKEPGVMALGDDSRRYGKRRYITLRIPESVARRVHLRLSKV